MTSTFHRVVSLLDVFPATAPLIWSVIISHDLYGRVKPQQSNPALSPASVCVAGQCVLFLQWIPEYLVLQQRLDWAPRPINIHDSCIAHKHVHTQWWSEWNRLDALIHRWIAALMDWGYLDIHTQLVMEWGYSLSSPHAQSWLAAQCRLANWPFHQINHTNFSDELSTVHTHSRSQYWFPLYSPGGHFLSASHFSGVSKLILLKCGVLCHSTCPWAYTLKSSLFSPSSIFITLLELLHCRLILDYSSDFSHFMLM